MSGPLEPTIVGGQPADAGEYPAQVFLVMNVDGGDPDWYCGGTLVAPTRILTAAHCVVDFGDEVPAAAVTAYMGENERDNFTPEHALAVADVDAHEDYDSFSRTNDIAMLTLSSTAAHQPLRVIRADEASKWSPGVTATVVGWGATSEGGRGSNELL